MPNLTRYFRFSLRTLLIVVAIVACGLGWLGYQLRCVQERAEVLQWFRSKRGLEYFDVLADANTEADWVMTVNDSQLSWYRKLLGDHFLSKIQYPKDVLPEEVDRVRSAFPEAEVVPNVYIPRVVSPSPLVP